MFTLGNIVSDLNYERHAFLTDKAVTKHGNLDDDRHEKRIPTDLEIELWGKAFPDGKKAHNKKSREDESDVVNALFRAYMPKKDVEAVEEFALAYFKSAFPFQFQHDRTAVKLQALEGNVHIDILSKTYGTGFFDIHTHARGKVRFRMPGEIWTKTRKWEFETRSIRDRFRKMTDNAFNEIKKAIDAMK